MSDKNREKSARVLSPAVVGDFQILNDEKLGRVFDMLDGVKPITKVIIVNGHTEEVEDVELVAALKELTREQSVMALYDRLGGGVKKGDRKVASGTFFDFMTKLPKKNVKINEEVFEDHFVLQRKPVVVKRQKGQDIREKVAALFGKKKKVEEVVS